MTSRLLYPFFYREGFSFPVYSVEQKWLYIEIMRAACGVHENIYMLERDTKVIDDVVFVGGTLWTDMNKFDPLTLHAVRDMMMDYRAINNDKAGYRKLKPADTCAPLAQLNVQKATKLSWETATTRSYPE